MPSMAAACSARFMMNPRPSPRPRHMRDGTRTRRRAGKAAPNSPRLASRPPRRRFDAETNTPPGRLEPAAAQARRPRRGPPAPATLRLGAPPMPQTVAKLTGDRGGFVKCSKLKSTDNYAGANYRIITPGRIIVRRGGRRPKPPPPAPPAPPAASACRSRRPNGIKSRTPIPALAGEGSDAVDRCHDGGPVDAELRPYWLWRDQRRDQHQNQEFRSVSPQCAQ